MPGTGAGTVPTAFGPGGPGSAREKGVRWGGWSYKFCSSLQTTSVLAGKGRGGD
ncbi:hypothetical protein C4K18_4754 [Pseudomonas chlororaphis subsp. aurantiaca]|nr:hypothetical protein C4K18_4754 [Pseudomonas chlororaphis subsp. aurantiaca]